MAKKRKGKDEIYYGWKPGSDNDDTRKYKRSPRVITIEGNTPLEIKQELEWELGVLEKDYPEIFTEEREERVNVLTNEFMLRLFTSLLSEFSKTDKSKNLQKDIAEPLMGWITMVEYIGLESFGSNIGKKLNYQFEMASNFKLEDLSEKESIKNKKPLRDLFILKEYELLLKIVKPLCKRKHFGDYEHLMSQKRFLDFRDRLVELSYSENTIREVVSKQDELKPSTVVCDLLASKYNKSSTTIRDLVMKTRKAERLTKEIFDLT